MASYTIIGGDGKEYGPITADDVRQWITEGRLNEQSLMKAESDAAFRTLEKFPEFAGAFARNVPGIITPLPLFTSSDGDYELDLGGCVSSGYELVKKNFGTLFVSALILFAMQFAVSMLLNFILVNCLGKIFNSVLVNLVLGFLVVALAAFVNGPLIGGFYLIYLKTIRGEAPNVGEIFAGFRKNYVQLVWGALVIGLVTIACLAPFNYVIGEKINPLLQQLQHLQAQQAAPAEMGNLMSQMGSAYVSALPILFVCLIPLIYLTTCWVFTLPLIADKQLAFGAAMKTSWKRVNQHWWQMFGLVILTGLVSAAGALACCVGLIFTIPLGFAAMMFGYETIFSGKKNQP